MAISEEDLFSELEEREPSDVSRAAIAVFKEDLRAYSFPLFKFTASVDLTSRVVSTNLREGLLQSGFVRKYLHSWCLQYLIFAKDLPRSNKWVGPAELKEGRFFFHGSHKLPVERLSVKFGRDLDLARKNAQDLGTVRDDVAGDLCFEISPFPRIPMLVVFWLGDEDFEAHTSVLFDASANDQLPIDVLWGIGHLVIEVLANY